MLGLNEVAAATDRPPAREVCAGFFCSGVWRTAAYNRCDRSEVCWQIPLVWVGIVLRGRVVRDASDGERLNSIETFLPTGLCFRMLVRRWVVL